MDFSQEEIAEMFRAELEELELGLDEDEDEEEDRDLKSLTELGNQLRMSMMGELKDGEDWDELMNSSSRTRARMEAMDAKKQQQASSGRDSPRGRGGKGGKSVKEDELQLRRTAAASRRSPSPGRKSPRKEEVVDLLDSMVSAVEASGPITERSLVANEKAKPAASSVDMSKLPKVIIEEDDDMQHQQHVRVEAEEYRSSGYSQKTSGYLSLEAQQKEKERVQEAMDMMRIVEAKMQQEADAAAKAIIDEDAEQRLQRKQRMIEEIMRARRNKSAEKIQSRARGILGRNKSFRLRQDAELEAARIAECLRVEAEVARKLVEEEERQSMAEADAWSAAMRKYEKELIRKANKKSVPIVPVPHEQTLSEHIFTASTEAVAKEEQESKTNPIKSLAGGGRGGGDKEKGSPSGFGKGALDAFRAGAVFEDLPEENEYAAVFVPKRLEERAVTVFRFGRDFENDEPVHEPSDRVLFYSKNMKAEESVEQYWKKLAKIAVSEGAGEVTFAEEGVDAAAAMLQRDLPTLFEVKVSTDGTSALPSPRAKASLGLRLVGSRNASSSKGKGETTVTAKKTATLITSDAALPPQLVPLVAASSSAAAAAQRKQHTTSVASLPLSSLPLPHQLQTSNTSWTCPLLAAFACWQQWCTAKEIENVAAAKSKTPRKATAAATGVYLEFDFLGIDEEEYANLSEEPTILDDAFQNNDANEETLRNLGLQSDPRKITALELNVEGLYSSAFLRPFCNLRSLELNVNKMCSLDGLRQMSLLEELSVKDNALTDINALRQTTSLRKLELDANQLSDISSLRFCVELTSLSVKTNRLTTLPKLTGCQKLQKLECYHNQITSVPLESLRPLTSLVHLDFGRNKLEHISGEALSNCQLLQTLVLSQNRLTQAPAPLRLPYLKTLWLSGNQLTDLSLWAPTPHSLDEDEQQQHGGNGGGIDEEETRRHSHLSAESRDCSGWDWPLFCPMLDKLFLQDNALTCLDASVFLTLPHLTELDVSFNSIEENEDLRGITVCPKLHKLQVQENPCYTSTAGTAPLLKWIILACPSIVSISGEKTSEHELFFGKEKRTESVRLMNEYLSTNRWDTLDMGYHESNFQTTDVNVAAFIALMGIDAPPTARVSGGTSSRRFQQLLSMLVSEQIVFASQRMYDRVKKRNTQGEGKASSVADSKKSNMRKHSSEVVSKSDGLDWDTKLVYLLSKQLRLMQNWKSDLPAACKSCLLSFLRHDRSRQPNEPFSRRRLRGRNDFQLRRVAASLIQALYRGFRGRLQLKQALDSAKYRDADLDEMINNMALGESDFNLDEYLAPPELDDGWLIDRGMDQQSSTLASSTEAMVYGDHRRARRTNSAGKFDASFSIGGNHEGESMISPTTIPQNEGAAVSGRKARLIKHGFVPLPQPSSWTNEGMSAADPFPIMGLLTPSAPLSPRPSSVMSDASEMTHSSQGNVSMHDDEDGPAPMYKETVSGRLRAAANQKASDKSTLNMVAQEWGINDPRVLAMMMRRSRKLQGLPTPKDALDGALRNTAQPTAGSSRPKKNAAPVTQTSGSFGGKPKVIRKTRRTEGKPPPAWMTSAITEDD